MNNGLVYARVMEQGVDGNCHKLGEGFVGLMWGIWPGAQLDNVLDAMMYGHSTL